MDKVQKIREEIEKKLEVMQYQVHRKDAYKELKGVLVYIDSLQEEPSKFDTAIQEGDDVHYNEDLGCRVNLSQLKRVAKKEEPVSEDLEKAADSYIKTYGEILGFGRQTFKGGAQWQKEQMIAKAIDATCFGFQDAALFSFRLPAGSYLVGSKVKVIIIKED